MPRKAENLKSLVRGRVRSSFNKHNLFNVYKKMGPLSRNMTLYQQKWAAKQETRAYHGEHLTENRWQAIFQPKLEGVAQLDASLKGTTNIPTPMVLQTFAALEKRLDQAIFRSMFASSVRQARQYILTQHVKVNGVTITHPSFTLKPGDIFSVTPEKVLEALGEKKPSLKQAYKVDKEQIMKWQQYVKEAKANPSQVYEKQKDKHSKQKSLYGNKFNADSNNHFEIKKALNRGGVDNFKLKQMKEAQNSVSRKTILRDIMTIASKAQGNVTKANYEEKFGEFIAPKCYGVYELLSTNKELQDPTSEQFTAEISKFLPDHVDGKPQGVFHEDTKAKKVRQQLSEINSAYLEKLRKDFLEKPLSENEHVERWVSNLRKHPKLPAWSEVEEAGRYDVKLPWQQHMFGLSDPSKPYFTPWKPRQFLAPFAILPKHIEISFETCHAVYLRDPVTRPGESEVITPFGEDIHERAYMYYVRKGM
ncbi:hypothetical protein CANARDRAFT_26121 [[Candida] arabinofermentans NRRL YB-2248]|uniref:Small ribosomal subunit protein uS4m n=1 Tax=[Candida] arabinofermentans NRRL YB-2248 TaxID=983967 RepID=A0A1E4T872_9ASCO|nr:hypothetical protein CANARDRAFT_26121 [[Candida] arabinofermentans NRRL YB-2248]